MKIHGQAFSTGILENIQREVDETPNISQRALSRRVCELLDWHAPNGRLKDMSCRNALLHLHKTGILRILEAVQNLAFTHRTVQQEYVRSLHELGNVILVYIPRNPDEHSTAKRIPIPRESGWTTDLATLCDLNILPSP
jgi:hypothetical protein